MQLDATRLRDEAGQSGLYLLLTCLNPLVSGPVKIGTVTHLNFFWERPTEHPKTDT